MGGVTNTDMTTLTAEQILANQKRTRTFNDWFFNRARGDTPFQRIIVHVILVILCLITIYPVTRIVTISIDPRQTVIRTDLNFIPENATFDNYISVLEDGDIFLWLWNSVLITASTAIIGVIVASTSAYAVSRWKFPGRRPLLVFLLTTQMIPAGMLLVPLYVLAVNLGLTNTWRGLVIAYSVQSIPFSVWILKGYYDTIPVELEQSAMIDGTSRLGAFYRIVLPLSRPALAIVFLFNFTQAWNDFLLARIMLQRDSMYTWPLGLQSLQGQFQTRWGEFSAAALMVSAPVMILYFASSKWLLSGLTLGSVKG